MMENKGIFLLTIALILLHLELTSGDGSLQNGASNSTYNSGAPSEDKALQAKLNATVSRVIEAIADNSLRSDAAAEQTSQEHAKKGRIFPRKGVDMNMNMSTTSSTPIVLPKPKTSDAQHHNTTMTPSINNNASSNTVPVSGGNATVNIKANLTMPTPPTKNTTSNLTASSAVPSMSKPTSTSTSTSTTSTTSTTTSTTTRSTTSTTTTTKPPKKPKITYSVDDEPKLLQAAKPGYNSPSSSVAGATVSDVNGRLHVEEPLAELSKEYIPPPGGHREYVVPVVTLIFAIPLLMGLFLLSYRRAKEFWLTRHYRRMDFLVDGMYNY